MWLFKTRSSISRERERQGDGETGRGGGRERDGEREGGRESYKETAEKWQRRLSAEFSHRYHMKESWYTRQFHMYAMYLWVT